MKTTIAAAVAALLLPMPAAAQWQTTCTQLGYMNHCSSGNARSGFNGTSYELGNTQYTQGYYNGRRVSCETYALGYSMQARCN